jgi:hypothetical protein
LFSAASQLSANPRRVGLEHVTTRRINYLQQIVTGDTLMIMAMTDQSLNITTDTVCLRTIPGFYIIVAEPDHADHDWECVIKLADLYDRDVNHEDINITGTGHMVWVVEQ